MDFEGVASHGYRALAIAYFGSAGLPALSEQQLPVHEDSKDKARPKPFAIAKHVVWEAYRRVKANKGAAGIDEQTMAEFERDLSGNLYKLWNRMSSGSYMPPVGASGRDTEEGRRAKSARRATVADRVAQTVAAIYLEPKVEPVFHHDSHGYRPGRSATQALERCRERCWKKDWVIDLDIAKFFEGQGRKPEMNEDGTWVTFSSFTNARCAEPTAQWGQIEGTTRSTSPVGLHVGVVSTARGVPEAEAILAGPLPQHGPVRGPDFLMPEPVRSPVA